MKVAHIISHTHWDREWYLPYETHHMRLIMLIDQILEAIDNDPDFKSFHLDGQTICIDDYLQVKPQNRDRVLSAIKSGKINIGPWYILQDAFLTSAEANVRNGYYGNIDCMRYGNKTSVGYYPDTFGIYAQAPQILKELEIDNMIFGRGVSTTGFNNEVENDFESKFSEMRVQSSDGSGVLGILFANWYSNGNEIPVDSTEAKEYWDRKLYESERYTTSNHLLFMNGCDHTPYQADVTKAIKVANELYPNIEFKQSSFKEYLAALNEDIKQTDLTTISGELTSQTTDGLYTLVNTASSRINQKIQNASIQNKYEFIAEPISALYSDDYMHSELEYGWKKLMQNHPHDSICGCSVDSVHNTMDGRFEDSNNVADHIINRNLKTISEKIDNGGRIAFTMINPSEIHNTRHIVKIEYKRQEFGTNFQLARDNMKAVEIPNLKLVDENGVEVIASIKDLGIGMDYYLPDDKFRRPYYSRNIEIEFSYEFKHIGHTTFYIEEASEVKPELTTTNNRLDNENVEVIVNGDGSIKLTDKKTMRSQDGLLRIYDQGDIGNEYMFGNVIDDTEIFMSDGLTIKDVSTNNEQRIILSGTINVPVGADELLAKEQLEIVGYNTRKSKRSNQFINLPIEINYSLNEFDYGVKTDIKVVNRADNHRMRVRFELADAKGKHVVDTAFEVITRSNTPFDTWKNKNFDHRMFKFVRLQNNQDSLTIATNGLYEYEVKDNYVDITMLRCTGELGDWGHFLTPEAQCKETVIASFYTTLATQNLDNQVANIARSIFASQPYIQLHGGDGSLKPSETTLDINHNQNSYISAVKRSLDGSLVLRFGSNGQASKLECNKRLIKSNMLEEVRLGETSAVKANQILTVIVED